MQNYRVNKSKSNILAFKKIGTNQIIVVTLHRVKEMPFVRHSAVSLLLRSVPDLSLDSPESEFRQSPLGGRTN